MDDAASARIGRMRTHAQGYLEDAALLQQQASTTSDGAYLLQLIAFEVLLKALLLKNGKSPEKNHKYSELLEQLPSDTRQGLLASAASRFGPETDFSNPMKLLDTWGSNFVQLRYAYEKYDGMTSKQVTEQGSVWCRSGAEVEKADFKYYPLELHALTEALIGELESP